jgi:hypothetical protein
MAEQVLSPALPEKKKKEEEEEEKEYFAYYQDRAGSMAQVVKCLPCKP